MKSFFTSIIRRTPKKNILSILFLLVLIVDMSSIFFFSSENGTESSQRSEGVTDKVATVIVDGYNEMPEEEKQAERDKLQLPVRKIAHFSLFALLGLSAALLIFSLDIRKWQISFVIPLVLGIVWAIIDELHQALTAGRVSAATDVLIDIAGAFTAVLAVNLCVYLFERSKRVHSSVTAQGSEA